MKKAVASGTERDIKNARTQFLKRIVALDTDPKKAGDPLSPPLLKRAFRRSRHAALRIGAGSTMRAS
jgi:hypothetical protein